jgi:hypothetical protein
MTGLYTKLVFFVAKCDTCGFEFRELIERDTNRAARDHSALFLNHGVQITTDNMNMRNF